MLVTNGKVFSGEGGERVWPIGTLTLPTDSKKFSTLKPSPNPSQGEGNKQWLATSGEENCWWCREVIESGVLMLTLPTVSKKFWLAGPPLTPPKGRGIRSL